MIVMAGILVWTSETETGLMFGAGWIFTIVATFCCVFPGNLVAATPFAVELEEVKGLRLYAPFKKLFIPIEEIKEVKRGFLQQGTIVKLKTRHRLLKSFNIHWAFGEQGRQLAGALENEIARRQST